MTPDSLQERPDPAVGRALDRAMYGAVYQAVGGAVHGAVDNAVVRTAAPSIRLPGEEPS